MKHFLAMLVASTAISGVGISGAMAGSDFTAALSAGPSSLDAELNPSGVADGYAVIGLLSGAYNFTPVLGAQGDLLLSLSSFDDGGTQFSVGSIDGALHGFYRDPDKFLVGGLVQIGQDTNHEEGEDDETGTRSFVGVEGQAFFDQFTIYGQAGLQRATSGGSSTDFDGWFATGEVRYFLTPDLKLEGHVGVSDHSGDIPTVASVDVDTVNLGVGLEYKFADLPFSVFGKYDYATTEADFVGSSVSQTTSFDTTRVLVGLKFNLGEDSLQARDRNGASLKPIDFGSNDSVFTEF